MLKRLKNQALFFGSNTDPGVLHGESEADTVTGPLLDDGRDENFALVGKFDGIAGEVHQDLPQPAAIPFEQMRNIRVDARGQFEPALAGPQRQGFGDAVDGLAEVKRLRLQFEPSGLHPGKIEQVVQQVAVQYRLNNTAAWVDLPSAYIADATTGGTATQETKIDVTLPAGTKAKVKMKSDNGDIFTDFDIKIEPTSQQPVAEGGEGKGKYRLRFDRALMRSINGGGPEMQFTTLNGNIYIRQKK